MGYILLGVALLLGVILLAQWFSSAPPGQMAMVLRVGYLVLTLVLALFFFATGRLSWGLIALGAMAAGVGAEMTRRGVRRGGTGAGGQTSEIETKFLRVTLHHDTGHMEGEVLSGSFAGRKLSDLTLDDLMALLAQCQADDAQSAQVLESYLDRNHADWRRAAGGGREAGKASSGRMSRREAWETLGLKPGASVADIKKAHRRLIAKVHPDHGGSTALAAKINEAKEILLDG